MPELPKVTNPQNTTPANLSSSAPNETEKKELEEILPQIKTLMAQYPVPKAFSQKLEEYDSKINQLIDQNKGSEKSPDEQKKAFEEIVKLERDRDVYQAYVECALYEKTALTTNLKNTELFRKFSKLNEKFNLTSDPTSPGRELIKDALATLLAGFVTYFVLPEKVTAGAHWAIRASAFVGRATLLFTAHNAINYLTERHHAVDVSIKAFNLNLVTFLLLGASGKVVDTASRQAILKLLCKDPSKMAHMAKKLDLLLQRSTYLKTSIEAAKLPVDVFALTVLGVSQALSEGQLPKENTLEFIFNKIMLHNLIFVAMLKTGGLAASKALASERGQILYNTINLKEQYRIVKANLAESIAKETNAEKKADLVETQRELEELNQKVSEKPLSQAQLVENIKADIQTHKSKIWESKSLDEQLEKNTNFFSGKLKTVFEYVLEKYNEKYPDLNLKEKISTYYCGSASRQRGQMPSSSDIDAIVVSKADAKITAEFTTEYYQMALDAGLVEPQRISTYMLNQELANPMEIPWSESTQNKSTEKKEPSLPPQPIETPLDESTQNKSTEKKENEKTRQRIDRKHSYNAFNDPQIDSSIRELGFTPLIDRKPLSGPHLLENKLIVNKEKVQFRLLSGLGELPMYTYKPSKNPRFKDLTQRPLAYIYWANKLGVSNIDIQVENKQLMFLRQYLSSDTNNFSEVFSEESFNQFLAKTENGHPLRVEFESLFGKISNFEQMQIAVNSMMANIQNKTHQLVQILAKQDFVRDQFLTYRASDFMESEKVSNKPFFTKDIKDKIKQTYIDGIKKRLEVAENFNYKELVEYIEKAKSKITVFFSSTNEKGLSKDPNSPNNPLNKLIEELNK